MFLSSTGLSTVVMKFIPRSVKLATIVGMGLQIALVGMTSVKIVVPNEQTIVGLGDIHSHLIWLSILGLVLIGSLLFHQVRGGILIGIFVMTIIDWAINNRFPSHFAQIPDLTTIDPSAFINFSNFDLSRCSTAILAFLFIGVIDVSGVVFGMASLAKLTDEDGHIPGSTPTFVAVSISTLLSALTGGTPIIVYVESAAGIKEGGRTGLTAVIISFYFLLSLFFAPILSEIPLIATAPVAILVGAMMMSQAVEIDWDNMSEAIPAFLTLVTMPFTFSITNGIVLGLITAFLFYITTGQIFTDCKQLLCHYHLLQDNNGSTASDGDVGSEMVHLSNENDVIVSGGSSNYNSNTNINIFSTDSPIYDSRLPMRPTSTYDSGAAAIPITSHGGHMNYGSSSSNNHYNNSTTLSASPSAGIVKENFHFLDEQPYVRSPSLILQRRDAEAVRNAKGHNLKDDEGHISKSIDNRRSGSISSYHNIDNNHNGAV